MNCFHKQPDDGKKKHPFTIVAPTPEYVKGLEKRVEFGRKDNKEYLDSLTIEPVWGGVLPVLLFMLIHRIIQADPLLITAPKIGVGFYRN